MKHVSLACFAVLALLSIDSLAGPMAAKGWSRSAVVRFKGYAGDGPLTNYPALIRLSEGQGGFSYNDCKADGGDIRFTVHNGIELPYECTTWNPAGVSEFWVRVPVLDSPATEIAIHWGNGDAKAPIANGETWEDGYFGVWHLDEHGQGLYDSTCDSAGGSAKRANGGDVVGLAGGARIFDSAKKDQAWIGGGDPAKVECLSYECFFKQGQGIVSGYQPLVSYTYSWNEGPILAVNEEGRIQGKYAAGGSLVESKAKAAAGQWHHAMMTLDGERNLVIYLDGEFAGERKCSYDTIPYPTAKENITLGAAPYTSNGSFKDHYFHGMVDEVRISCTARSADYARAVFQNLSDYEGFVEITPVRASGTLLVTGDELLPPGAAITPAYGTWAGQVPGATISCSAPAAYEEAGVRYECIGYRLSSGDTEKNGTETHATVTFDANATPITLTWLWKKSYRFDLTADAGGSVSPAGTTWQASGDDVTLTATTDDPTMAFHSWRGDCPTSSVFEATIVLPADRPRSLAASFGKAIYLAADGDDSNDGLSAATPKATLPAAIACATTGKETIWVAEGLYDVKAASTLSVPAAIRASGDPAKTVFASNNERNLDWLQVTADGAIIDGLTITGFDKNSWNHGAAINAAGNLKVHIQHCVFTNNFLKGPSNTSVVRIGAGWIRDSLFIDNKMSGSSSGDATTLHLPNDGTGLLVDHCRLIGNEQVQGYGGRKNRGPGVAVEAAEAYFRNCLFADNRSFGVPEIGKGAVALECRRVRFDSCTFARNSANGYGAAVYCSPNMTDDTPPLFINCAFSENEAQAVGGKNDVDGNAAFLSCSSAERALDADGNLAADAVCKDPAEGDFSPASTSPTRDAGRPAGWNYAKGAVDLSGESRSHGERVDIGAFEYVSTGKEPLACAFSATLTSGLGKLATTFTAVVMGDQGGLSYRWDFGDGEVVGPEPEIGTIDHTYVKAGTFTVTLQVSNTAGESALFTLPTRINVTPLVCYVSHEGTKTPPYGTPEEATDNIADALAVGAPEIRFAEGVFEMPGNNNFRLAYPVRLKGAAGHRSVLNGLQDNSRRLVMDHPDAIVECLVISNCFGSWNSPAGLLLESGLVTNCIFRNGRSINLGAVQVKGGTLACSKVCQNRGCVTGPDGRAFYGAGINVQGPGTILNCEIVGNIADWHTSRGAGVYINSRDAKGFLLRNCLIASNTNRFTSTERFPNKVEAGTGVFVGSEVEGAIENCTIAGNYSTGTAAGLAIESSKCPVSNTIVYGNIVEASHCAAPVDDLLIKEGVEVPFTTCSSPDLAGVPGGNQTADPCFRAPRTGDYRLQSSSPCFQAGTKADWMADALDLLGQKRMIGRSVEIGCYELDVQPGFILIIR